MQMGLVREFMQTLQDRIVEHSHCFNLEYDVGNFGLGSFRAETTSIRTHEFEDDLRRQLPAIL